MPTAKEWKNHLKKNPMVWIFVVMMLYFAIGGLELERKIPDFFAEREHKARMKSDAVYATDVEVARTTKAYMRKPYDMNPKEQVEAMLAARAKGFDISIGCSGAIRNKWEPDIILATCIETDWSIGSGMSTGSHTTTILDKIEREGLPRAGVLHRWRMLADGCIPGDDSSWCRDFEKAMACTNGCMGGQMVQHTRHDY